MRSPVDGLDAPAQVLLTGASSGIGLAMVEALLVNQAVAGICAVSRHACASPELAALVVLAGQVRPGDQVLEPSAGTGLIAIVAEACGGVLTLNELAALIGHADLAVGVDTGLVHLATALNVPTIALYISTDPALTGVHGVRSFRNLGGPGHAPEVSEVLSAIAQELR